MNDALKIAKKYWRFSSFRKPQEEIINAVLEKKNVLALLPTGGGKSVCFQIPALLQDGICIVISPLIALMQDQVENLTKKGIKATTIPSKSSQNEIITLFDNLKFGGFKFLYISPERLQSTFIQQKIKELNVNLIAVDEAHCISEWGHDFRPSYRNIKILKELQPNANFIALTASATQKVVADISKNLELKNIQIYRKSFYRENLAYQIFTIEDKLHRLKQIFKKTKTPAIIYVNSRKKTVEISDFLKANNFKSGFYHGGLSSEEKEKSFKNWMSEKKPIMVATNAFGMGIDKENVGVVVHLNIPNSLENYVQEAGRAGRNGKKAFSVVLQNENDIVLLKDRLKNSLPTIVEIKEVSKKLYQHFQIAVGEIPENSIDFNFLEFCRKYQFIPNKVTSILHILSNHNLIEITHNFNQKSIVQFIVNSRQVLFYGKSNTPLKNFTNSLLRSYGGLFEQETKIDEFMLAKKTGIISTQVFAYLNQLKKDNLIIYKKATNNTSIQFLAPREDDKAINRISKEITQYLKQKQQKVSDIIEFIQNNRVCRNVQILSYFNEQKFVKCGICDVCLSEKKKNNSTLSSEIIQLLQKEKFMASKEICSILTAKEKDILIHLRNLLSKNSIGINNQNKFYIK